MVETIHMIKLLSFILAMVIFLGIPMKTVAAESNTVKKVCINVLDSKSKKQIIKCKPMRIHKKHNGIIVPKKSK